MLKCSWFPCRYSLRCFQYSARRIPENQSHWSIARRGKLLVHRKVKKPRRSSPRYSDKRKQPARYWAVSLSQEYSGEWASSDQLLGVFGRHASLLYVVQRRLPAVNKLTGINILSVTVHKWHKKLNRNLISFAEPSGHGEERRIFLITGLQRYHGAPQWEVHMLCDKLSGKSKLHCRAVC